MGSDTRRVPGRPNKKNSSPPILSHEFVIQNHGDITSVLLMIVFLGFMFPMTSPIAAVFLVPQYNATINVTVNADLYTAERWRVGMRDIWTVLFYMVSAVTTHAIIQEYILDKLIRKACRDSKLSLSKTRQVKLNESGEMVVFAIYSLAHVCWCMAEYVSMPPVPETLWVGYPDEHKWLTLKTKFFFIIQLAYWLHQLPEFYLQKLKLEEIRSRLPVIFIHVVLIAGAYIMNLTRVAMLVLSLEHALAIIFHLARILHFVEAKKSALPLFRIWNISFVAVRLVESLLVGVVLWHGLKSSEVPFVDVAEGNFNTSFMRLNCLFAFFVVQMYAFGRFVIFHWGQWKEGCSKKKKVQAEKSTKAIKPGQKKPKAHAE